MSSPRFCVATSFYGISFNITGFGLNIYLTQFTYALIELPAKVTVYYLLDKIGRRGTEVGAMLMAGVCLGINIVVPTGRHSLMPTDLQHPSFSLFCCFKNVTNLSHCYPIFRYACSQNSGSSHWKRVFFSILCNCCALQF